MISRQLARYGLIALGTLGAFVALAVAGRPAVAQQPVAPCVTTTSSATGVPITSCQPVSAANPLPTTGGGGGGGSVTQGTVPWVDSITTWATGTLGAMANYGTSPGAVLVPGVNAFVTNPISATLAAGTAIAGKLGIDQTTPGTTNGVAIVGVNAATALAGAGATGTGSLRVTAAQDTTTIAGSAPGTAGSASANVVTVQGVASMTKLLVTPDANSAVNVAQINGVTPLMGNGTTGTGSQRVTVASDNTAFSVNTVTTNNAAAQPHICGSHVFKHITSATDTQAVAANSTNTIYVCDYSFSSSGAGDFYLEKATSGTCATLTQLTGAWYLAANVGKTDANPYYRGLNTGASAQLCIHTDATITALDIDIYYDQY